MFILVFVDRVRVPEFAVYSWSCARLVLRIGCLFPSSRSPVALCETDFEDFRIAR